MNYNMNYLLNVSTLDNKMIPLTRMIRDKNAKWPENEQQKHDFCSFIILTFCLSTFKYYYYI